MAKVVFCIPVVDTLHPATRQSLLDSLPVIEAAGWEHEMGQTLNNPYISCARAEMLRKALDAKAEQIVFIDHDVAWRPEDMLALLAVEGDVVAGTYRFKSDEEQYMGWIAQDTQGCPITRKDGCVQMLGIPAGFMRISRAAVSTFARKYPELCYGDPLEPHIDLFNHGARDGVWWGEDLAFSDRWLKAGGELWALPHLHIDHYDRQTNICYAGNLHNYLLRITKEHYEKEKQSSKAEESV